MLWSGTAASAVDLNPANSISSQGVTVFGDTQAGLARGNAIGSRDHATLWHGTAASAVDLNPAGFISSAVTDNSATTQVGYGYLTPDIFHALAWNGSADSFVDLHSALEGVVPNLGASRADCILPDGTIIGTALTATNEGRDYLVVWTPSEVPEPISCALVAGGFFFAALLRKRRCRLA
jgi:hypothetical protein